MEAKVQETFTELLTTVLGKDIGVEVNVEGEEITVKLPAENMGRLIGKSGRNIKAIREMVYLYNKFHDTKFHLEILE